jgi:hypothetical protein
MMKCGEAGMKKNHDMSLISHWFEEEMEQEPRIEYRAASPFFFGLWKKWNRNVEQNIGLRPHFSRLLSLIASYGLANLITLIIFAMPSYVFAEKLDNYCITHVGYKPRSKHITTTTKETDPAPVNITVDNKQFHIVVEGRYLLVMDENNATLSKVSVGQKFGRVHNVTLGKNGWLWIDGDEKGYMVKLDLTKTPPTLGEPVQLPNLKAKPCSVFNKWFDNCSFREVGAYSSLLDRVFITGHRVTLLGSDSLASYEMIGGQAKLLPAQLQGARLIGGTRHSEVGGMVMGYYYYEDLPNLNGVLFEGRNGEAFFYDGMNATSLLAEYLDQSVDEKKCGWSYIQAPISKRFFLHNINFQKPFFVELKAGPILTRISTPREIDNETIYLYEFPNDLQLFGVARHSVVAEVNNQLRTVLTVPEPSYMFGSEYIDLNTDKAIRLTVHNPTAKVNTDYFLSRRLSTEKCITPLNTNEPIVLNSGLKR